MRSGGRPSGVVRLVLTATLNSVSMLCASVSHGTSLSVASGGNGLPVRGRGGWCGDGRVSCWNVTETEQITRCSAIDNAPPPAAGSTPVATTRSQPFAAGRSVSNWLSTSSAATRGASAADDGFAPCTSARTDWPAGNHRHVDAGQLAPRSPAARTPAPPRRVPATAPRAPPSVRRPRATPTSTTTHAFRYPHFRRFWLRPAILRHDRGLAASPPVRYSLRVGGV